MIACTRSSYNAFLTDCIWIKNAHLRRTIVEESIRARGLQVPLSRSVWCRLRFEKTAMINHTILRTCITSKAADIASISTTVLWLLPYYCLHPRGWGFLVHLMLQHSSFYCHSVGHLKLPSPRHGTRHTRTSRPPRLVFTHFWLPAILAPNALSTNYPTLIFSFTTLFRHEPSQLFVHYHWYCQLDRCCYNARPSTTALSI